MCLRFQFCTHQRVCILYFLKKVKFVVPYCPFSPLGSRIHSTHPPAHCVAGSMAPIRRPIGLQDPQHPSTGPLGCRIHITHPPAHWVAGSTAPIHRPIGLQDPHHPSTGPLGCRIHITHPPAHGVPGSKAPIRRPKG
jgi:hypothetical protein